MDNCNGLSAKARQFLINSAINAEAFNQMNSELNEKIKLLESETKTNQTEESPFRIYMNKGICLIKNARNFYEATNLEIIQRLVGSIFKEKFVYRENEVRTGVLNHAVSLIQSHANGFLDIQKKLRGTIALSFLL